MDEEWEDGEKLKKDLSACQQFLVDTEIETGRYQIFNFQKSKLDTKVINEKLDEIIKKMDSAVKTNIAHKIVLCNVDLGEYRYN